MVNPLSSMNRLPLVLTLVLSWINNINMERRSIDQLHLPASNVISLHYGYNFSNRGQITAYMPRYSTCSYFGMFQMKVPNNTTWSSTDAQNLIYGIVDAMNTNFNYPTLTTGDTVGVTVLDNNRFKIFDTATNIPFDFQNSGTAHITFGSIVPGSGGS